MEVILAIAVLFASTIALAQLASLGRAHADRAEELTTAQVLCQNTMNEVVAGLTPLMAVTDVPIYESPGWAYSIEVQPANWNGIVSVKVSVSEIPLENESLSSESLTTIPGATTNSVTKPSYSLVRWLRVKGTAEESDQTSGGLLMNSESALGALP